MVFAQLKGGFKIFPKERDIGLHLTPMLSIPPISHKFLALIFRHEITRYGVSAVG